MPRVDTRAALDLRLRPVLRQHVELALALRGDHGCLDACKGGAPPAGIVATEPADTPRPREGLQHHPGEGRLLTAVELEGDEHDAVGACGHLDGRDFHLARPAVRLLPTGCDVSGAAERVGRGRPCKVRRLAQQLVDPLLGEEDARTKLGRVRLRPRPACRCALELTHVEAAVDTYDVGFVAAAPACSERVRRTLDEQFEMLLPTGLVEKIGDLPRVQVILQTAAGDSVSEVSAHDHPREGAQLGDFLRHASRQPVRHELSECSRVD
mmetsp:Transcript_22602/g.58130  ORF Transcript_22602/g.58130 Transcript_22602/m.58130 type:complete len:267 (-) Transcript_22602:421-1221(-)